MSVSAISGISSLALNPNEGGGKDGAQQGSFGIKLGLETMKQGVQDVQNVPTVNGVRAAPSLDPEHTLRLDKQGLQKALDSGDVTATQHAMVRIVEDNEQIAEAQQKEAHGENHVSALPQGHDGSENGADPAGNVKSENGKLLNVMA
jgi:hypothetical protein